ncbi:hypothetical protein Holit_02460 [Hollandina sp. SP2]
MGNRRTGMRFVRPLAMPAIPTRRLWRRCTHPHSPDDFYVLEGFLKHLTTPLVEQTIKAECTKHRGYENHDQGEKPIVTRRKGKNPKGLKIDQGPLVIEVPRDRAGTLAPLIVQKYHRECKGCDDSIRLMYDLELTIRDTGSAQGNLRC